jgi:Nif-specific regulatory protein
MSETDRLRRRCEQLEALYGLASDLLQTEDYDAMLDALVRGALAILRAERGFLVLKSREALDLKVVRNWRRTELEGDGEPLSRTILAEVLRRGEPLLVEDALSDPRFAGLESVTGYRIRSVLAAPLEVDGSQAGALYLESRSTDRLFGAEQLELFRQILRLSSRALSSCTRRLLLEQRNQLLEKDLMARYDFQGIFTRDPALLRLLRTVAQVSASDTPVLVQGPSGSGKELIVRALHCNSPRARKPFVTVNCGAISAQLLESELFGHVRGAFTGAMSDKPGLLRSAHTGTLFLDEVGELPKELQVKLLRTLQFGEVQPVGSARVEVVDVRFLAATNRDLERDAREGRFREDLLYRLNVITLDVPALRQRPDDVLPLFYHFLEREAARAGRPEPEVTPRLERALLGYDWPGNVRELENEVRRLLTLTPPGLPLTVERLSRRIGEALAGPPAASSLSEQEKELIELHLRLCGGNRTRAARSLGISRDGLRRKMLRFGLS